MRIAEYLPSFPRRRESSLCDNKYFWIPAFAGMTGLRPFWLNTYTYRLIRLGYKPFCCRDALSLPTA